MDTVVAREPDLTGAARAWRLQKTEAVAEGRMREFGYADSGIDTWLVNGPFHPFWSWWMVSVIHLRPIPGAPPAKRRYPEAEYEFIIVSLNPKPEAGRPATPDIDLFEATGDAERALPGFLMPPDVVVQFHGVTDEQAREICEHAVRAIVSGGASPDSDYRSWWESAIPNTVKHVLGEPH